MKWQRSPQYADMPEGQYSLTDEGKRAKQAFADWGQWMQQNISQTARPTTQSGPQTTPSNQASRGVDMSAYSPGRAQSVPQPPSGTPYGKMAPSIQPTNSQPQNPYANMEPGVYQNGQRIPGDMTSAINTAMQRNAATAHLYNQAQSPYSFFGNALGMNLGAPQNDPQAMFRKAQEMVNAGWQNPLQRYFDEADTAQRLAQQSPPTQYRPPARAPTQAPFQPAIPIDGATPQQSAAPGGLTVAANPPRQASSRGLPVGLPGYYNDKGELFKGTISFAPDTPVEYQERAYADWARNEGYTHHIPPPSRSPFAK